MKARFFALAALVLGLASCQQEFDGAATVGGEVDFQLNVAAPDFGTRADDGDSQYGFDSAFGAIDYLSDTSDEYRTDWTEVDLRYTLEVYDAGALDAAPVKDRMVKIVDKYEPVAFDLRLVPNRPYRFVVFADFVEQGATVEAEGLTLLEHQKDLGLHHVINGTLQNITIKADGINDECTDAYFATKDITVVNSVAEDIVLRRPYGKVRVIATDLNELNLNVEPKSVKVTYDEFHANAFNAVEGTIDGEYETKVFTNEYNDIKKTDMDRHIYTGFNNAEYMVENANGEVRNTHMTLFTDYILANVDQETIHFTMEVIDANDQTIKTTNFCTDIPVQRNYLTTIIGNVLTTATEVNVTIDDNFGGYHNVETIFVSSFIELYNAVNNYKAGQVIIFEANIIDDDEEKDIVILQKEGVNVVINGNGHKFDGCITINGNARANGAETVLLQNIKFETERSEVDFISAPTKMNGKYNYSHNVTVKDCTFESKQYNEKVVGIKLLTTYNAVIKNVSAKNMHSLAQFQSTDNETVIEDAKVENCKNGISLGNMALATIKNIDIAATGYGIRLDGAKERTVATTIENATIAAYIPVNVRKMNNDACNVDVEFIGENNVLTGSSDYEIAFCSNEYEEGVAPVAPVGTFRLQNAEEARAFYGGISSFSAFDAAINSVDYPVVTPEGDIHNPGLGVEVERDVTIDFAGHEFNAGSTADSYWYALEIMGAYDVNIKNANFTRAGIFASENANVVFENGTINHKPERSSRYIFCAQSGATITVKDGTFTNDREKNTFFWADNATIIVEGGVFNGVKSKSDRVCGVTTNGGKIIIKGGSFNFDPSAWLAKGYLATKNGSMWVVALEDLSETLASAEYRTIYLADGNDYGTLTAGELKNVTIVANDSAAVRFVTTADSKLENVTIQNAKFEFATGAGQKNGAFVVIDAAAQINNLVVEGCTIVGDGKKNSYGIYGQNPSASIVVKDCNFSNLGYAIQATAGGGYESLTVENCSFANINSWVIMPQYGFNGDLTVTGCTFDCCSDGLIKTGAFNGNIFTFTNNAITNSAGHDGKDSKWFEVNASTATKVVSGNTKDGAEWTPADAEGLK